MRENDWQSLLLPPSTLQRVHKKCSSKIRLFNTLHIFRCRRRMCVYTVDRKICDYTLPNVMFLCHYKEVDNRRNYSVGPLGWIFSHYVLFTFSSKNNQRVICENGVPIIAPMSSFWGKLSTVFDQKPLQSTNSTLPSLTEASLVHTYIFSTLAEGHFYLLQ